MIQIRLQDFKIIRSRSYTVRYFSEISGLSTTLIQKIERCENVNLNSIERYLNALSKYSNDRYLFVFEPKKTTQKD